MKNVKRKQGVLLLITSISICVYCLLVCNYVKGHICNIRGTFIVLSLCYFTYVFLILRRVSKTQATIYIQRKSAIFFLSLTVPALSVCLEEYIWNPDILGLKLHYFLMNYILFLVAEVLIALILQHWRTTYSILLIFSCVYGIVNHYVLLYKGNPLLPSDVLAIGTAAAVLGAYEFPLNDSIVLGTFLLLFLLLILSYCAIEIKCRPLKKKTIMTGFGVLLAICSLFFIMKGGFCGKLGISINGWNPSQSYALYGAPISFCADVQNMQVSKPTGYSEKKACEILESYCDVDVEDSAQIKPSVIVIMNESLADLSVLGEFESEEYLSELDSMKGCIQKGYVYASVHGGGTCNSEFEFLTGNSMANFNTTTYPYQTIKMDKTFNLPQLFNELGYETVAFHPYTRENWNRDVVYHTFGFDSYIANDDLENIDTLGWDPSDSYDYKVLIDIFEKRDAPIFIFNVTMQNHGGYTIDLTDKVSRIKVGKSVQKYNDVVNYLTLIRESDKAFADLIAYFSQQEDPVIVCMFGDHQPALDSAFVSETLGETKTIDDREKQYMTPYVIWSNYMTDSECVIQDISINYLGANILKYMGVHSAYTDYLLDLQEEIPVINIAGYQTADMSWHSLNESNDDLAVYRQIQYYQLFR